MPQRLHFLKLSFFSEGNLSEAAVDVSQMPRLFWKKVWDIPVGFSHDKFKGFLPVTILKEIAVDFFFEFSRFLQNCYFYEKCMNGCFCLLYQYVSMLLWLYCVTLTSRFVLFQGPARPIIFKSSIFSLNNLNVKTQMQLHISVDIV